MLASLKEVAGLIKKLLGYTVLGNELRIKGVLKNDLIQARTKKTLEL